jgi:hypothetical protein
MTEKLLSNAEAGVANAPLHDSTKLLSTRKSGTREIAFKLICIECYLVSPSITLA